MQAGTLAEDFANPPAAARPWVFWYWMHGEISPEGITADLEAFAQAGIGGVYLMPIKDLREQPLYEPTARQLSPRWWEMLRHAFQEADRVGLKIALHACDGFATGGGPLITPELAMQKVIWSATRVSGGNKFAGVLPQPPTLENYYRDIAVLAFPAIPGSEKSTLNTPVKIMTNADNNPDVAKLGSSGGKIRTSNPCWILYEFEQPFTCRSIVIRGTERDRYQVNRMILEVSDGGENFRALGRLEAPRHGWQDQDADFTHSIVPTTAKFFRFTFDPEGAEEGAGDLDFAKWRSRIRLTQLELSGAPRIQHYEGKSAQVWRSSSRTTAEQVPDKLCVPLDQIIDLTKQMRADGGLDWDAPQGEWTILRIGHTPTGHKNETGGGGKGLECDKFNPAAAQVLFDGWFGETIRQVGPELASRVLKIFHVDSWEAGSQNWSPVFLDEFIKRRGYDPTPYLPLFAGVPIVSADVSERFLFDVRWTISELTIDGFFEPLKKLSAQHGCEFSAECTAPTMPGDGMRHFGVVDLPMGEFWLRSPTHDKPNDIHDAISGAHVYGRNIVQAEAFTELRMEWDEHPGMLKPLADQHFALGINRLVFHVAALNPWLNRRPGTTLDGVGLYFQRDQTWWPLARAWTDYVSRCSALLQHGRPVVDVAYFTGEEVPRRAILPERRNPPLPEGYKADSINRDALLRLATVKDNRIELPGGASYTLLVLPDTPYMTPQLAQKIRQLVQDGALVFGPPPQRSPSLENYPQCDHIVQEIAAELWNEENQKGEWNNYRKNQPGRAIWGKPIKQIKSDELLLLGVRWEFGGNSIHGYYTKIEWTRRSTESEEIYFISNTSNQKDRVQIIWPYPNWDQFELWNPQTAQKFSIGHFFFTNASPHFVVDLEPYQSAFVIGSNSKDWISSKNVIRINTAQQLMKMEGDWQIFFDPKIGGPAEPVTFDQLSDWSKHEEFGIRHYSGIAGYHKEFEWDQETTNTLKYLLDLGEVHNLAEVTLNGVNCGLAWTPPLRVEITQALRKGKNDLEIRVANTWANRLIGDNRLEESKRLTWTTAPFRLRDKPLLPAGLLGPVSIMTEQK